MSLINDMLRDIEAKRPDDPALHNLQREIRSLPPAAGGQGRWLKPLLLVGLPLAGALALYQSGIWPAPSEEAAATVPAASPSAPVSEPATVDGKKTPVLESNLRLSPNIAVLPTPAPPVLLVPDPVASPPVVQAPAPSVAAKVEPPALPVEAPKVAAPVGPVKIEKSPVLATARDRADAEFRKAENALAAGRNAEAVDALRAALKHDPAFVQGRQLLLRHLLEMRKVDDAMAVLQEGLDQQPAQTGWAMSLARLQLEHNDLAAADRTLARSQAYAEASADYAGFQGHLKSRLGSQRAAANHYQRAVRLAPGEGRWWLGLGLALEADGRPAEAKDALRRSLATSTLSAELTAVAEQHLH